MSGKLCSGFLVLHFLSLCFTFSTPKDPGLIKFKNLDRCQAKNEEFVTWDYALNNVDADEWKSFDLDAELRHPITDTFTYTLVIDHYNHGDWETNIYNMGGKLCELLMKFVPKAWNKMGSELEPIMDEPCNIKEGTYKLRGLQVLKDDIEIPPVYGKVRANLKIFNDDDENVLCVVAIVDVAD